jgi:heptosyltransferase-1
LDYKSRGRFLTDKVKLDGYSGRHVAEYYFDLLNFIGINASSPGLDEAINSRTGRGCTTYSLEVSEEVSARAKKILAEHGIMAADLLIGVAPGGGASWGKDAIYKQWPAEKFRQLTERLTKASNVKVVLLGSVEEKPLAEIILEKMGQSPSGTVPIFPGTIFPIIDLTGKLNLKELAAVISELKALICNDGGLLHMAVALGVKTVSTFGPVDEIVYGPYPPSAKHIVVKKDLPCRPCYKDFRFTGCSNNRKCLEEITVEDVFDNVKGLLRLTSSASQ